MLFQTSDYGVVHTKTQREVVLLNTVGGCSWGRCAFCEFCRAYDTTAKAAEEHNQYVLSKVTGVYETLQVICSANFSELPASTWFSIGEICKLKGIQHLIVESHWMYREQDRHIRNFFSLWNIDVQIIYGIETFDFQKRELEWFKGYGNITIEELKQYTDSINLLIGVQGQSMESIRQDLLQALPHFKHIYVYAYEPSAEARLARDYDLLDLFYRSDLFNTIKEDPRFEIMDGLDNRAPDHLGYVGVGAQYD